MLKLISAFCFSYCFFVTANASAANLELGFGPSVPKSEGATILSLPAGVSRNGGGEHLYVNFKTPKTISSIKLISYSTSRSGKVLIRSASAVTDTKQNIGLDGLSNFSKMGLSERSENYQNLVMLADQASVSVQPNLSITGLDLVVEGFANNDASVLLQITSNDDLSPKEFMATRSSVTSESVGGYFDEKNYARFTIPQLQLMMKVSKTPTIGDLAGKNFSCSGYFPKEQANLDFKTRQYFVGNTPNILQSSTDINSHATLWIRTQLGWTISTDHETVDCGKISQRLFIRMTPDGNLISEWVIDINEFVNACVAKNFDATSSREVLLKWNPVAVIDPKFVTKNYEFCRQVSYP